MTYWGSKLVSVKALKQNYNYSDYDISKINNSQFSRDGKYVTLEGANQSRKIAGNDALLKFADEQSNYDYSKTHNIAPKDKTAKAEMEKAGKLNQSAKQDDTKKMKQPVTNPYDYNNIMNLNGENRKLNLIA